MCYRRILTVQDLSCLGQCSALVAHPVLSAWGHEVCLLPTALLSTHTGGLGDPYVLHLTQSLPRILAHWQQQGITFDAILVGYLGAEADIDQLAELERFLAPGGVFIVDPAMADHGRLYRGLTPEYAGKIGGLAKKAHILLPNLTEAAILAGVPCPEDVSEESVRALLKRLPQKTVVLTGAVAEQGTTGIAIKQGEDIQFFRHAKAPGTYSGTGDLFAACFTGGLMKGKRIEQAAAFAARFTARCAQATADQPAHSYGLRFEPFLKELGESNG